MRDVDTETMNLSDDLRVEEPAVDADALAAAALALADAQHGGSFVSSFEMTPRDLAHALALTQSQLPQLQAECDPSDDVANGWRRVRGKKGSRVRLWERGRASALTRSGDGKLSRALRGGRRKSDHEYQQQSKREPVEAEPSPMPCGGNKEAYAVRSSITVHAPLATVMKTLDCSTATSYRSFTKIMYENLVADTSVLAHERLGSPPLPDQPPHLAEAVAVRWVVCKSARPLVADCDLSLVEYTKVHSLDDFVAAGDAPTNNQESDGDGDGFFTVPQPASDGLRAREKLPAAYKIFRSMETRHCPALSDAPHYLERTHVPLGGFLLYSTDNDDVTDVVFFCSATYDRRHAASAFRTSDDRQFRAIQHVLHRLALGIGRIANAVDAYTMSLQLETLRLTRWVDNSDRTECVVCFHRFHPLTRRRHHCRLCGDVICRDCSIHKDADLPTIGPTTLRICKLCDVQHFGRASVLASIATDAKKQQKKKRLGFGAPLSAFQQRELALETTTFESPTMARRHGRHRRATDLSVVLEASKSSATNSGGLESPKPRGDRRRSLDLQQQQPTSCPKPTLAEQRWTHHRQHHPALAPSPTGKWSKAFFASRAAAGSRTPLPTSPPRFAQTMPVASSATKPGASAPQRFNFGRMKHAAVPPRPRQLSSGDISLDLDSPSSSGTWKTASMPYPSDPNATPPARKLTRGSSLYSQDVRKTSASSLSENQSLENENGSRASSQRGSLSLGRRARLDDIAQYEDLLRDLCERASDACGDATYAALSLFTSQNPMRSTSDASALTMAHYLKVRDAPKLLKIAPNLRCCEPILKTVTPLVTRNALTCKLEDCDLASLPFVRGPQQARFYAGVPLVDAQLRLVGALAVFDAQLLDADDELLVEAPTLLASLARATMNQIESRRAHRALETFMSTPLLRQSEPTEVARRACGGDDLDDDDEHFDDEEEERVRMAASHGPMGAAGTANSLQYYKQQMHRLVQQANRTQDAVLQTRFQMHHGVSY